MTLTDLLNKAFREVKTEFRNPKISGPKILDEKDSTAYISWLEMLIGINPEFVKELAEAGDIGEEKVARGLYFHEFGHYFNHPNNFAMSLFLSYSAHKNFKDLAENIYPIFVDLMDNTLTCSSGIDVDEDLKDVLTAHYQNLYDAEKLGSTMAAIYLGYKELFDLDIDVDLSHFDNEEEIKYAVKEISGMTISLRNDFGLQYSQLLKFGNAIKPLLEHDLKNMSGKGRGIGGEGGLDDGHYISQEDVKNMSRSERNKVEDEIKKLSKDLPRKIYENIKKYFGSEDRQESSSGSGSGIGMGSADTSLGNRETIEYYRTVAKEFGLCIRPKRGLSVEKTRVPMELTDFSPSRPTAQLNLSYSGGKIIPGISKVVEENDIVTLAEKERVPRLMVFKDVSGSMEEKKKTKDYATIAATMFTLSYLRSGAEVGISLFDDGNDEMFTSVKEDELMSLVCGYKGGGTYLDIGLLKKDIEKESIMGRYTGGVTEEDIRRDPMLKAYMKKSAKITKLEETDIETDLVIITDGGIANIGEVVGFMKENPSYRPVIIHTGGMGLDVPGYDQKTSGTYEGITIYKVDSREDLLAVTKKTIHSNLLQKYNTGSDL